MANHTIHVERRETRGKQAAKAARRAGRVPGVLYGDGKDPVVLSVDPKAVEGILAMPAGMNTIVDLELAGTQQRRPVMIHEYQRHPVQQALLHVDFIRINMQRKVHVRVHVRLEGTPNGVKNQGGILEFLHREIELECLPGDIPKDLPVDVSALNVGQSVRVSDLGLDPARFRVFEEPETVLAVVALPAAEKETAAPGAEEAAPAAEPELIKKPREKDEGGDKGSEKK